MKQPEQKNYLLPDTCWNARDIQHDGIIIHFISARNVTPKTPYDMEQIRKILIRAPASCHNYIDRSGVIWNFVPEKSRAWHAGKSKLMNWSGLNDNFLGIELAGKVDERFEYSQYESLAWLIAHYMDKYPNITTATIKGHEDVSDHTVRQDPKRDPGPYFDWLKLGALVSEIRN